MECISLCSLPVASLVFQPRRDRFACTIICKATYRLAPGILVLASTQEPIRQAEVHCDDDPLKSLLYPTDFVPFKPRVDVVVVGNCHAPRQKPVHSVLTRIVCGEIDKSVEVFSRRTANVDGVVTEGATFTQMPLSYELAGGGPGTWNVVGIAVTPDAGLLNYPLPQLAPSGFFMSDPRTPIPPTGYGPIAAGWPVRREKLGSRAANWSDVSFEAQPLDESFDPSYFQSAPHEQQMESLRPDERILLENMHSEHAHLIMNLPGLRPAAFVRTRNTQPSSLSLRPDTLVIDTRREILTVTYRGQIPLVAPDQAGTVHVVLEEPGTKLRWTDIEAKIRSMKSISAVVDEYAETAELSLDALQRMPLPFRTGPASWPQVSGSRSDEEPTADFSWSSFNAASGAKAPAVGHHEDRETKELLLDDALAQRGALPFGAATSGTPVTQTPAPNPVFVAPSAVPSYVASASPPAPAFVLPQPSFGPSPWTNARLPSADVEKMALPSPPAEVVSPAKPLLDLSAAGYAGALAASNAAALSKEQAEEDNPNATGRLASSEQTGGQQPPGEEIELIWFDPDYVSRVAKHPAWAPLLGRSRPNPPPRRLQRPPTPEEASAAAEARISTILSRGTPSSQNELSPKRPALEPHGSAMPALFLLADTLVLQLDEVELLKETIKAATPLAPKNKKLEQAIANANEVLSMPLDGSPEIAENSIKRMQETWAGASQSLPPDYLVTQAERAALQKRLYQRRTLLDNEWIRATLPEGTAKQTVPVYLPAKLDKRLPLFRRFPARLIVEVLPKQDMYEVHPIALRVIALARLLRETR